MSFGDLLPGGLWFTEKICPDYIHAFRVGELLYRRRSKYQLIEVVKHKVFGKILFLDGKPQVTEYDEWIYHEALVHPAMLLSREPRRVLILGGGDGGALREVLKHDQVREVLLIDLDPEVIETVRRIIPSIPSGAFEDKRVKLIHEDGVAFLRDVSDRFDVIIVDVTDPFSGISAKLFVKEFYELCRERLSEHGVIVTQAESIQFSHMYFEINFPTIVKTLEGVFGSSHPYYVFVPSFASEWGFVVSPLPPSVNVRNRLREEAIKLRKLSLRFLNEGTLLRMFSLPTNVKELISREGKVIDERECEILLKRLKKANKAAELLRFDVLP